MDFTITVNNCPDYAKDHKFIIARNDDNQLWFYGAFDDKTEVNRIAKELGDSVIIITNNR